MHDTFVSKYLSKYSNGKNRMKKMHPSDNLTCVCDKKNTKMASRVELYVLHSLSMYILWFFKLQKKVMFGAEFGPRFKTAT